MALRAIKLDSKNIEPEQEWHVAEFEKAVRPGLGEGEQVLAPVELGLPAGRQFAAQGLLPEHIGAADREIADQEAGSRAGPSDEAKAGMKNFAHQPVAGRQRAEQASVRVLAAQTESGVENLPIVTGEK